jgi:hypothetical protein
MTPLQNVLGRLSGVKKSGDEYSARCPAHEDRKASLSLSETSDGAVLLKCHAGCNASEILAPIGLELRDLFPPKSCPHPSGNGKPKTSGPTFPMAKDAVAHLQSHHGKRSAFWTYHDVQGDPCGLILRWDKHDGKHIRPVAKHEDGWRIGAMPEPRPLYGLPKLAEAKRVIICEGEKATDAARNLVFVATTSAGGSGAASKSDWTPLAGKNVLILPDNDAPGRKYAETVAGILGRLTPPAEVRILDLAQHAPNLPEGGDLADVLADTEWCGLPLGDNAQPADLAALLKRLAQEVEPWQQPADADPNIENQGEQKRGPNYAEQLVRLAHSHFRFGRTEKDDLFAVALKGPNLAIMLKGSGDALRAKLARMYRQATGRTPGASALADAMTVLAGEAMEAEPEPVHLRLAAHDGGVVIDLGNRDGRAVIVRPGAWEVVDRSPILFRRTALTGALPTPTRGGTLTDLREFLNVTDESWPLIAGWLVAALLPDIPHAVLLLSGLQGTGKSCAARELVLLVDPSAAPLRSEPRDLEQWQIVASGSWAVAIDNLSHISAWLSDALCKAATGDGLVKRKLYTDGDLAVIAFRRVVLLTSIDAGALRGDLGDRLLLADLEPIPPTARRCEREIDALFAERQPSLFGALLDALAAVLAKLPHVRPAQLPRMADFGRVLAAADAAEVTEGALERFCAQQGRIAGEVIDADPFGVALVDFMRVQRRWDGTATELLAALRPDFSDKMPYGFPKPNGVKGRLKRLTPALATQDITVTWERQGSTRERRRLIYLVVGKAA